MVCNFSVYFLFKTLTAEPKATVFVSVICGGLVFALLGATSPAGYVPFAVLYGFMSGGCESCWKAWLVTFKY